jgi:hypothetical protein
MQINNLQAIFGGSDSTSGGEVIIVDKDKIKVPPIGNPT